MRHFEIFQRHSAFWRVLLFAFALAWLARGGQPAPMPLPDDVMPPNPRLYERIAQGQVRAPRVSTGRIPARLRRAPARPGALTGSVRALAVLVDFNDKPAVVTANYFNTLLFAAPVAGRGSLRDYFDEVSYGQIDIVTLNPPNGLGWLRAPSDYAYYRR